MFFYGANLAIEIQQEAVKSSQNPTSLISDSPEALFVLALALMGLGGSLILVGSVDKRKQSSSYTS